MQTFFGVQQLSGGHLAMCSLICTGAGKASIEAMLFYKLLKILSLDPYCCQEMFWKGPLFRQKEKKKGEDILFS